MKESYLPPGTWRVSSAIARVTFLEVVRDRILYNILICAVLLFSLGFLASRLDFIHPERVTLDFGMSAVSISCAMVAVFAGATLVGREFDRRTIYVVLSHPISRLQFVFGKFLGLSAVVVVNWFLLILAFLALLGVSGQGVGTLLSGTLIWGLVLVLLQGVFLGSIAVFLSTFSTTSLSAVLTIGIYLVGCNVPEIRAVAAKVENATGAAVLRAVAAILPDFGHFNLGNRITYSLPVEHGLLLTTFAYWAAYTAFFVLFAGILIRGREV